MNGTGTQAEHGGVAVSDELRKAVAARVGVSEAAVTALERAHLTSHGPEFERAKQTFLFRLEVRPQRGHTDCFLRC